MYNQPLDFRNMKSDVLKSWNGGIPVTITVEMAAYWLSISEGKNPRNIVRSNLEKIKHDLMTGQHTSRSIVFHKDGWLGNGQHLLTAILETGMPAEKIFVELGYNEDEISHIDIGSNRSFGVTSKLLGLKWTSQDSTLANAIESGLDDLGHTLSHEEKRYLVTKHEQVVSLINSGLKGAKMKPLAMKKALADVYFEIKHDAKKMLRFKEFMHVYSTLDTSGGSKDQAAPSLFRVLQKIKTADRTTRPEVYSNTIIALKNFMENNPSKRLRRSEKIDSIVATVFNENKK